MSLQQPTAVLWLGEPRRQYTKLLGPLLVVGELEIVTVRGALKGAVGRVGEHNPIVAKMTFQLLEKFVALGQARDVFVAEITDLVTEHQQYAVILRDIGETRALGAGGPFGLVLLHKQGVDVSAHREAERRKIVPGGLL